MNGTDIVYIAGLQQRPRPQPIWKESWDVIKGIGTLSFNGTPITWDSVPVYDTWGPNWLDGYWMCDEWKAWHVALVQHYGLQQANIVWLQAWNQMSALAGPYNCKWNSAFVAYLISNGLASQSDVGMIIPNIVNAAGQVVNAAGEVVEAGTGTIVSLSGLLPLFLVGAAIYFGKEFLDQRKKA